MGKTGEFSLPVIGAMFGTHEREPDVAEEFWTSVAKQGDSTTLGDPAATLDAWLVGAANMRKGKTKDEIPSQLEVYNACVRAWNAHRNRKTFGAVSQIRRRKRPSPTSNESPSTTTIVGPPCR